MVSVMTCFPPVCRFVRRLLFSLSDTPYRNLFRKSIPKNHKDSFFLWGSLLLWDPPQTPRSVVMAAPEIGVQVTVANRISCMKHLSIPHIHPHMAHRTGGCIGSGEKNQVTGPCPFTGHDGALVIDSFRCCPWQVVDTGLCVDPADIPAAVKGGCREEPPHT